MPKPPTLPEAAARYAQLRVKYGVEIERFDGRPFLSARSNDLGYVGKHIIVKKKDGSIDNVYLIMSETGDMIVTNPGKGIIF
jgi:hypothetical protein